jgi:tRNA (mo5U34)-methyltransferase
MDRSSLQEAVGTHTDWFHCINLGNGVVTPGTDGEHSRRKLELMDLPVSVHGMRVLDVGCCEGFFSFAAEQRGAERVTAIDTRPQRHLFGFEQQRVLVRARRSGRAPAG